MEPADRHDAGVSPVVRPAQVDRVFAGRTWLIDRYAEHLADTGVTHGLIGPRERPRLWDRHILNCAAAADLLPKGATVADVGSGAGLPGIVLAIARPDVQVTLIEPLLRRVTWLDGVLEDLALTNVRIERARAQQLWDRLEVDVVTSRAVARLEDLAQWSLPLLVPDGTMLALKGSSAPEELERARPRLTEWGVADAEVLECTGVDPERATIVVRLQLDGPAVRVPAERTKPSGGRRKGRSRSRRQARSR